jgi:hypothetical protein
MPISKPFLVPIQMLQTDYKSNKGSWFWWLFFPSHLGKALDILHQSDCFESQVQAVIQIYAAMNNLYFFQKYFFSSIRQFLSSNYNQLAIHLLQQPDIETDVYSKLLNLVKPEEYCIALEHAIHLEVFTKASVQYILSSVEPKYLPHIYRFLKEQRLFNPKMIKMVTQAQPTLLVQNILSHLLAHDMLNEELISALIENQPIEWISSIMQLLNEYDLFSRNTIIKLSSYPETYLQNLIECLSLLTNQNQQQKDLLNAIFRDTPDLGLVKYILEQLHRHQLINDKNLHICFEHLSISMTQSLLQFLSPQALLTQQFLDFMADHGDAQHIYINDIIGILDEMHLLKPNVLQKLQARSDFLEIFKALCNLKQYSECLPHETVCLDILEAWQPAQVGGMIKLLGENNLLNPERYETLKKQDEPKIAAQGVNLLNRSNLLTTETQQALLKEFTPSKNQLIRTLYKSRLLEVPFIKTQLAKIITVTEIYALNEILTLIIPLAFFKFKNIPAIFNKLIQHPHLDGLKLALDDMQSYPKLMSASHGLENFLLIANLKRYYSLELCMMQLHGSELLISHQANQYFQDILKHPKPEEVAEAIVLIKESELLNNQHIYQSVMTHPYPSQLASCINTLFSIFPNYQEWLNLLSSFLRKNNMPYLLECLKIGDLLDLQRLEFLLVSQHLLFSEALNPFWTQIKFLQIECQHFPDLELICSQDIGHIEKHQQLAEYVLINILKIDRTKTEKMLNQFPIKAQATIEDEVIDIAIALANNFVGQNEIKHILQQLVKQLEEMKIQSSHPAAFKILSDIIQSRCDFRDIFSQISIHEFLAYYYLKAKETNTLQRFIESFNHFELADCIDSAQTFNQLGCAILWYQQPQLALQERSFFQFAEKAEESVAPTASI